MHFLAFPETKNILGNQKFSSRNKSLDCIFGIISDHFLETFNFFSVDSKLGHDGVGCKDSALFIFQVAWSLAIRWDVWINRVFFLPVNISRARRGPPCQKWWYIFLILTWPGKAAPQLKCSFRDLHGGAVDKTLCSQCRGPRVDPWSGN